MCRLIQVLSPNRNAKLDSYELSWFENTDMFPTFRLWYCFEGISSLGKCYSTQAIYVTNTINITFGQNESSQ